MAEIKSDNINHPAHYTFGNIEVLDAIEDWGLPYHLGNCVKYIARAGRKDPTKKVEDLKKAQFYLERYIRLTEGNKTEQIHEGIIINARESVGHICEPPKLKEYLD